MSGRKIKERDKKIQLRFVSWGGEYKHNYNIEYRVDPKELKWYQKIFNFWREIKEYSSISMASQDPDDSLQWYKLFCHRSSIAFWKNELKTLGDVMDYECEQYERYTKDKKKHKEYNEQYESVIY